MTTIRRRLRFWVAAWLLFQVASLSALVPRACCVPYQAAATDQEPNCHGNSAAAHCPVRAAHATPCPMHQSGHHDAEETPSHRCSMRATCDGPVAAMFALLSNYGVLSNSCLIVPDVHAGLVSLQTRENLITRLAPPDSPPPRT
jgi:hypothetical protein